MATKAGVGMSRHHNPSIAGREAAVQALEMAGVDRSDFVFMFASIGYDQHSLLRAVRESTGGAPLSGCSAEGTINGEDADESNYSVLITAISLEEMQWTNGTVRGTSLHFVSEHLFRIRSTFNTAIGVAEDVSIVAQQNQLVSKGTP